MKTHAQIVIIGGGVTGCGLAYHLAKLGESDVVLVEKNELTAGATWHAAGHVMHYSASAVLTRLQKETTDFLWQLEKDTGQSVGFHQTGAIRLITQHEQLTEFRRAVAKARVLGLDMEIIGPEEVKRHFPLINTDGLIGGVWTPGDGHADPSGITFAYAKGARAGGVEFNQRTKVTALEWNGREWNVTTDKGVIKAEKVVNCAGMWGQEIANMVGVTLPLVVFMHQHLVTEDHPTVKALQRELVLLRDPIGGFNCRQEGRGFLSGVYEHAPEFVFVDGIPPTFGKELMAPNYDRSADFIARAIKRVPALGEVGIKTVYNGPTSRTPDHQPLLGPVPGVPNYFSACGYAAGIVQAGVTRYVAEWIVEDEPGIDMAELDVRRFGVHANRAFTFSVVRAGHAFSNLPSYPYGERSSGRPARTSALHDRLDAARAVFGVRNGWEVPCWLAPAGAERKEKLGFRRPDWFEPVGAEIRAMLQGVGLVDLSYLSKFEVSGPGAAGWLDRVFACRIPKSDGEVTFGPMLTVKGGIASCLSIARLSPDRFLLVGPGENETRDADHLARARHGDQSVLLDNATGRLVALLVTGPKTVALLAGAAKSDLTVGFTAQGFPEGAVRRVGLGYTPAIVIRRDETGCGDWLVLAPAEFARTLYDTLREAGAPFGASDMGVRAWDALRLEQGVGAITVDIDRTMTPEEAGIGHLVDWGKTAFTGRDAARARKPRRRLSLLAVESGEVDPYLHDTVYDGEAAIALVGSGGYGYKSKSSLALTSIPVEPSGRKRDLTVEIYGRRYPARLRSVTADTLRGATE
jgi:dimethylglycine dehydrogenase